jgi:hypothetical protein
VRPIDEGLSEVDAPTVSEVLGERAQDLAEDSFAHPLLEPAVARLVRRKAAWQRLPWRTRPQHPENSAEDWPGRDPWSPLTVSTALLHGDKRFNYRPLLVCEFHVDV